MPVNKRVGDNANNPVRLTGDHAKRMQTHPQSDINKMNHPQRPHAISANHQVLPTGHNQLLYIVNPLAHGRTVPERISIDQPSTQRRNFGAGLIIVVFDQKLLDLRGFADIISFTIFLKLEKVIENQ